MTLVMPRQDFHKGTRSPVIDHMPAFAKKPGGNVVAAGGRMTDSEGNINAYDIKDLAQKLNAIHAMMQDGQVGHGAAFEDSGANLSAAAQKKERHEEQIGRAHV